MKQLCIILLCLCIPSLLTAQDTEARNEVGLVFSGMNNFGLTWRTGSQRSLWRVTSLFVSGGDMETRAIPPWRVRLVWALA
jgi:hypothetical protein